MEQQPSQVSSGQKVLKSLVALSLSASLCPTAAFAAGGGSVTDDTAPKALSTQGELSPATQAAPQATVLSDDEATVGDLKYRLNATSKEACVIEYANYSNRPDNLIIPETIEVSGTAYTVTAIGDEEDVSGGQICGKESLTIPATVKNLYGIPFADTGDYYFLGPAPEVTDEIMYQGVYMWGGANQYVEDGGGAVYILAANADLDEDNGGYAYYNFTRWAESMEVVEACMRFVAPESVAIKDASGADKTGQTGEVPVGRTVNLTAMNAPEKNASKFKPFHKAITWTSSNEAVATVKDGAVTVAADATDGAQVVITATNALGQSASYTVRAQASNAKDISTVVAGRVTVYDMFAGFVTEPSLEIKDGDYALVKGKDYTLSFETAQGATIDAADIKTAGTYNLVIAGAGTDYSGTVKVPFNVVDSLTAGGWQYRQKTDGVAEILKYVGTDAVAAVPSSINGLAVSYLAANAFAGAVNATKVVIPDTVKVIDSNAFSGAKFSTLELLGNAPVASDGVVSLPAGAKVNYSGTFAQDAFGNIFGSQANLNAVDDLWSYHVTVTGAGDEATSQAAIESAADAAYRGASADDAQIVVPSEIDGKAITRLGQNALGSTSGEVKAALVTIPASVASIGDGAFTNLSAPIVRVMGACPDADSATGANLGKSVCVWYPAAFEEGWKACSWTTAAGSFDGSWDMSYSPADKAWSVAGYLGDATALEIPQSYCGTQNVKSIAAGALDGAKTAISKLTIPATVTSVAAGAFKNVDGAVYFKGEPPAGADYATEFTGADGASNAKTMYYPIERAAAWTVSGWVASGKYTFESYGDCNAANYEYKSLGEGKYEIVKYLGGSGTAVQIPSTLDGVSVTVDGIEQTEVALGTVVAIGDEAFSDSLGITSVIIPDTVESLGVRAFFNCRKLSTVDIRGNGLKSIDESAFWNTVLTTISLPASVESIADGTFISQTLTSIDVAEGNTHYCTVEGVLYSADKQTLEAYPMGKTDASYTVLDGTKAIARQAFRGGVGNCSPLAEVVLPDGLESIGWRAFAQMYSLAEVDIPDSVTELGTYAFATCPNLTRIELPAGTTAIPEGFAQFCDKLSDVALPDGVKSIGEWAFGKTGFTSVTFPEGLETIGPNAYEGTMVASLTFPESLVSIGDHAFYLIDELETIDLMSARGLKTLGIGVFAGDRAVKSIEVPNNIEQMGNAVFGSMSSLESITFEGGSKLAEIPAGCFQNDASLTTVTIPASVERVGDMAFYNCMGIKDKGSVVFQNKGDWELGSYVFSFGTSYDPYTTNVYGYRDSTTAKIFDDETLFHSIDLDIAEELAQDEQSSSGTLGFSSALVTLNGDVTFVWYVDGEEVARTEEGHLSYRYRDYLEDHDLRLSAYNSYDPYAPVEQVISFKTPAAPEPSTPTPAARSIEEASVSAIPAQTFTGSRITPLPIVSLDGKLLVAGVDYELSFGENVEMGAGSVTITGIGSYRGSLIANFAIRRPASPAPAQGAFVDVPRSGEWYSDAVYGAVESGLMAGYAPATGGASTTFGPHDLLTRGQIALVLYRMVHGSDPALASNAADFEDNTDAQYYTAAVNWAAEQGILTGSVEGGKKLVRPDDAVTRQELAAMIHRFAKARGLDMTVSASALADKTDAAAVASWARDAVAWTSDRGILGGFDNHDGTFAIAPDQATTRAEAAKVVSVAYKMLVASYTA